MALPSRPKHQIYAAGYYKPRRVRPVHFLPPMKVKLKDPPDKVKLEDTITSKNTDEEHMNSATKNVHQSKAHKDRRGRYKKMVMTLTCNLTLENVADMKFLCKDHVSPPHLLDKVRYPRDLITLLENQHLLAENSLYLMQTLLYYISRLDLYELVLDFRADMQRGYREKGVNIKAVYDIRNDTSKRVSLAQELSQFRQDLKPKSRLQQADVHGLRNRLNQLTTKMHDNVSQLKHTTAAKRSLEALRDASKLPEIQAGGVKHNEDSDSDSDEKEGAVVKLKLHDRYETVNKVPERKVRKRSRIPSERLSMVSSSVSISNSDVAMLTHSPPLKSPIDIPQVRIIIPNVSYEQDERLRLSPHLNKTGKSEPEEAFRYMTPIPPPRSENLSAAGKVSRTGFDEDTEVITKLDTVKLLGQNSHTSTASTGEDCGHGTGAELDTQNLSTAIQKLRRKMGIKNGIMANGHTQNNFQSFQRTRQSKSKKRRKDRKHMDNANDARSRKVKSRKLAEKTPDKLPDIYDKFARHKKSLKAQYMNILK